MRKKFSPELKKGFSQKFKIQSPPKKIPLSGLFYASLAINTLSILGVLILRSGLPPEVPLFYGLPEGQEQLAPNLWLVIASLSSFVIVIANATLAFFLKNEFLKKILIVVGFCVSIFSVITILEIIMLVGSF